MSYRNKLRLKRLLIGLLILAGIIAVALLIGFTYLGRYVIYTENGAHFSFNTQAPQTTSAASIPAPSSIVLTTGEPVAADQVIGNTRTSPNDTDVVGVFLDYDTLASGNSLNQVELGEDTNNTLAMEVIASNHDMLNNEAIDRLINRSKNQDVWLVAVISCLSNNEYALEHPGEVLRISNGAYWIGAKGTYWMDPSNESVKNRLVQTIAQLSDMGFDEVVLEDYYFPSSGSIVYDYNGRSAEEISVSAYNELLEATMDYCKIGVLVDTVESEHPLLNTAERLYVEYYEGSTVRRLADAHQDQYLVFITDSHDTRFDAYGKLMIEQYTLDESDRTGDEVPAISEDGEELPEEE